MMMTRRMSLAMAAMVLSLAGLPAVAATTVDVSLWDKGGDSMNDLGKIPAMGIAMDGAAQKDAAATMGITLSAVSVPAGEVTFVATNASKETIHEMIVSPLADQTKPLPYTDAEMRVDEETAGHLGEVAELDPGKSGALTVTLEPGTYILYCNIPGHYVMGMWTLLTVTP